MKSENDIPHTFGFPESEQEVWRPPDIAKTYRGTGSSQDKPLPVGRDMPLRRSDPESNYGSL
jgi:hypothetical protein